MTDAAHMLSDFASFLISLFSIWMATRPPSKRMSFGWHRAGNYVKWYMYIPVLRLVAIASLLASLVGLVLQ